MPSGVCTVARRSAAPRLRGGRPAQGRFETPKAETGQSALHPIDDAGALADQVLALTVGPLGIFLFRRRDLCYAAMARLAAQPTENGALQQLGIEPIRLRPARLARHGNTCRVDHISLDAASSQPPCQPEAVPAGFVGHRDPIGRAACLDRFVPPAIPQPEQRRLIGRKVSSAAVG